MKQTEHHVSVYDEMEAKQGELNELLLKLSKMYGDDRREEIREVGRDICEIYRSKVAGKYQFRHQYHHFIEVLQSLEPYDLADVLLANLRIIIEDNKDDELMPALLKLYDHISIDIARMSIKSNADNAVKSLESTREEIGGISNNLDILTEKTDSIQTKLESTHIEIVAILGVFSAIVIGFTGGLDIIGGALSNVGVKDFSLILFSVSLCGMVLFDVLWLLLEFVIRIVRDRKERVIGYVPVLLFNIAMIVLMCVAFFTG